MRIQTPKYARTHTSIIVKKCWNSFFAISSPHVKVMNIYSSMHAAIILYTQGDSDVISMPAGFCRHLVGKTLINVLRCDSAEIRFVGKIVITWTFS